MHLEHHLSRRLAPTAAVAGLLVGLVACAGTLDDAAEFSTAFAAGDAGADSASPGDTGGAFACGDVPTTILQATCGVVGCHYAASPAEGLDLASPGVASRLIDVPGTEDPALGLLLIDSVHAQQSIVLTKLRTSTVPYGAQMPLGGTPLTDNQVSCVAAWIASVVATADAGPDSASD
jgi:hypothetical protein